MSKRIAIFISLLVFLMPFIDLIICILFDLDIDGTYADIIMIINPSPCLIFFAMSLSGLLLIIIPTLFFGFLGFLLLLISGFTNVMFLRVMLIGYILYYAVFLVFDVSMMLYPKPVFTVAGILSALSAIVWAILCYKVQRRLNVADAK